MLLTCSRDPQHTAALRHLLAFGDWNSAARVALCKWMTEQQSLCRWSLELLEAAAKVPPNLSSQASARENAVRGDTQTTC